MRCVDKAKLSNTIFIEISSPVIHVHYCNVFATFTKLILARCPSNCKKQHSKNCQVEYTAGTGAIATTKFWLVFATQTKQWQHSFSTQTSENVFQSSWNTYDRLELILFSGETFARLVDNYMRPAIHKGVPPLFNNIRSLYTEKDKVMTWQHV